MSKTYQISNLMNTLQIWVDKDCSAMMKALVLPEILQEIFCHLGIQEKCKAAQVSRLWHDVTQLRQIWKDMTVGLLYDESEPSKYTIAPLEYLDSKYNNYNSTDIQPYWREYPQITKLAIRARPTDKAIHLIVQRFKTLVSLNLCWWWFSKPRVYEMSDTGITLIVGNLRFLRHLDLSNCRNITDMGIGTLCSWNGVGSDGNVPLLHSLSLSHIFNLTNDALRFLSVGQPSLQSLNLSMCRGICNSGLKFLIKLVNLRVLNLKSCYGINDDGMIHLAQMVKLTDLNLSSINITSAGLELLTSGNSRLTSLSLFYCNMVDDTCAQVLARMTHLVKLNLGCTNIGDKVLQCLADGVGASEIGNLNLMLCDQLTDKAGLHLARMVNLRDLNLVHSPVSDAGLRHLADAKDSRIEILSLVTMGNLTDAGLTHVGRLPRLRKLNVCQCDFFAKWALANPRIIVNSMLFIKRICSPCNDILYPPPPHIE